MKTTLIFLILILSGGIIRAQNATEIIEKAEEKMRGESSRGEMQMKIIRPSWERTISFKTWGKGTEYSMTLVTAPAKEEGQTFLKRENELWQYNPTIDRMIKLPPSMMSQGWMGSDFSNDDILKESSLSKDYDHKILTEETIDGTEVYKIELLPKEDAAVVWGKIVKWISKDEYLQLKSEYYDVDDYLIKTETASDIKTMDGRVIPTYFEIIPADEEGNKTVLIMEDMEFDVDIDNRFFSQQNMKQLSRR
ncbi:MAG: outer membrane lipoprotein-sorting protein [Bacteroidota bacterium]